MRVPLFLVAATALSLASAPAFADDLLFTSTDGSNIVSFTVDSTGANTQVLPDGSGFGFATDVTVDMITLPGYVAFYSSEYGGGFEVLQGEALELDQFDSNGFTTGSQQEFVGDVGSQTFVVSGPFLTSSYGDAIYLNPFTSNITAPVDLSDTPEPSAIVLLGTGLLGVAGAVRRRTRA